MLRLNSTMQWDNQASFSEIYKGLYDLPEPQNTTPQKSPCEGVGSIFQFTIEP